MTDETTIAVEVRNAVKQFGPVGVAVRALDDVSVTIRKGEFFTLLGPSGCGKTTLLRLIAGFGPDVGRDSTGWRRYNRPAAEQAPGQHCVPDLCAVSTSERGEKHRFRAGDAGSPALGSRSNDRTNAGMVRMEEFANRKTDQLSMDYGMTEKMAANDVMASVYRNGAIFRSRLQKPDVKYGYPKEGYILWMDQVALLSDAQNVDEAYKFLDFILVPENAALISALAHYANGIAGSEPFMPADMKDAPEIVIPAEFKDKGVFMKTCSPKAQECITAIWTELQK